MSHFLRFSASILLLLTLQGVVIAAEGDAKVVPACPTGSSRLAYGVAELPIKEWKIKAGDTFALTEITGLGRKDIPAPKEAAFIDGLPDFLGQRAVPSFACG